MALLLGRRTAEPLSRTLPVVGGAVSRAYTPSLEKSSRRSLLDNRTGVRYGLGEGGVSLTKHDAARKQKIIDYIAATLRARGYPPSVREIAKAVGLASTSAVHHHLAALEREGYLERGATQSRAIRLTPTAALQAGLSAELVPQIPAHESFALPVIGEIAAGGPIEAYQDASETLSVPDILAPSGDAYVLKVRGDSMIDAHIEDGDFVVIRPQQTARNGDIVVAQVEENAVTLKRFFKDGPNRIRLQPANDAYPPQIYDDVRIQGKLIGVIRRLD